MKIKASLLYIGDLKNEVIGIVKIAEHNSTARTLPSLETMSEPIRQITTEKSKVRELNQNPFFSLKDSLRSEPKLLLIGSNIPTQFIPLFKIWPRKKTIPIPPPNSIPKLLQIITYTPPPGTVPLVTIAEMDNVVRTSIMYDKNKITKVPDIPKREMMWPNLKNIKMEMMFRMVGMKQPEKVPSLKRLGFVKSSLEDCFFPLAKGL